MTTGGRPAPAPSDARGLCIIGAALVGCLCIALLLIGALLGFGPIFRDGADCGAVLRPATSEPSTRLVSSAVGNGPGGCAEALAARRAVAVPIAALGGAAAAVLVIAGAAISARRRRAADGMANWPGRGVTRDPISDAEWLMFLRGAGAVSSQGSLNARGEAS